MTIEIFILLIGFQIKHLIADYYLQYPYMYMNKGAKENWFRPLLDHTLVHALGTLVLVGIYGSMVNPEASAYVIAVAYAAAVTFDFVTHFITDRWKATRGRAPDESAFWTDLGIDQMVHHTVGIIIVFGLSRWIV